MERVLVPLTFVGGFIVGKNWNKIAKFSGPYVKNGIKGAQKITSNGFEIVQKGWSDGTRGATAFFNKAAQNIPVFRRKNTKHTMVKSTGRKSRHKVSTAPATA